MEYTNAQKLSAVLSEWARPGISQIATSKLCNLSMLKSFQQTMVGSGLVGQNYSIASEILPFANNAANILIQPMLCRYLSHIPDESLPQLAHSVVDTAMQQPSFSVLDGLVEFTQEDMTELKDLLVKNLPVCSIHEAYHVLK